MARVVVVGGGWAGCAAAYAARKAGAQVILIEKADMLLGTGLVGGIMRNNGRFSAAEEIIALGGGEFFDIIESVLRHKNIEFPGHRHACLYDVSRIEPLIKTSLEYLGVTLLLQHRMVDAMVQNGKVSSVILGNDEVVEGDAFVDATGTAGPMGNCVRVNGGCVMCIMRCPTFGPRVSLSMKAGVAELTGLSSEALSGSCKLEKESLGRWLVEKLDMKGVLVIPVPQYLTDSDKLKKKACQQYATREYAENLILLDTGSVKMMTSYFPLDKLRKIPGFECARYKDPYSGGKGNSVRYSLITPHNETLKVEGISNLFCAGEKVGLLVGHTEAIATGLLAGHNSARVASGMPPIALPKELAIGDMISFILERLKTQEGMTSKYTFAGSIYFQRMKELNLYTTDVTRIHNRVKKLGLFGVFSRKISVE
jgi:hypothetical protein